MKPHRDPNDPNVVLQRHEKRITKLERRAVPTADLPGTAALAHQEGRYHVVDGAAVTVSGGGTEYVDWELLAGDDILDVTAPAAPVVVTAGWYTVDLQYSTVSFDWTVGAKLDAVLEFIQGAWAGSRVKDMRSSVTIGAEGLPSGGDTDTPWGFVSLTGWLEPGDEITVTLGNHDSASHDLVVDSLWVNQLYLTSS